MNCCELSFDQGTLLLSGVDARCIDQLFAEDLWTFDPRVGKFRTDALHYTDVANVLKSKLAATLVDQVPDWKPLGRLAASLADTAETRVELRADQRRAVEAWLVARRGCVVMPTGTGKTEVALHLIQTIAESTLIVAPVRDLMYQWHRRILARTGIDAGILGDGVYRVSPLTVTTYDSAYLHMARLGQSVFVGRV